MKIYFWGPSSSGKTWLFNAFIRRINQINDELTKRYPEYGFQLLVLNEKHASQRINTLNQIDFPTTKSIDYKHYTFSRACNNDDELFRLANVHTHELQMMDGRGDETTGTLPDGATESDRSNIKAAQQSLKEADCLIICVDRGNRAIEGEAGENYLESLNRLITLPRKENQKVCVCFTKSDLYATDIAGFDATLTRIFGANGNRIGEKLRTLNNSTILNEHFYSVSSVGSYLNDKGNCVVNFDGEKVIDEAQWTPVNVELPFFYNFDIAERDILKHIMLIRSNFWEKLTPGKLLEEAKKDLNKEYLSYDQIMRLI
jgi:GTPase SAR1 family protein